MSLIDSLADGFRWWASPGALLAMLLIWLWLKDGLAVLDLDQRRMAAVTMFLAFTGIMLAGGIIPWASDGRLEGFTRESPLYRTIMMAVWFCWGASGWVAAVALSASKWRMAAGSVTWLVVAFAAAEVTVGARL